MIVDGSEGWYWQLKSLAERTKDCPVKFSIIEREIGDRFCARTMGMVEGVVAYDIGDADTLLGILFDESLKSKCIAAIDASWCLQSAINITIVLVQGADGYTNIDADVMDCFAKVFQK